MFAFLHQVTNLAEEVEALGRQKASCKMKRSQWGRISMEFFSMAHLDQLRTWGWCK